MLETAAAWHARFREPENDPASRVAQQSQFDTWLAADPRHARAYDETATLWDALEAPVRQVMLQEELLADGSIYRTPPRRFMRAPALLAACLAFFVIAGLAYQQNVLLRLESDHMTAVGERTKLALADGSHVTLNTDSAIAVDLSANRRDVHLLQGEAWFDVAPDEDRPFFVQMPEGQIRVTGTSFGVRRQDGAATVSLTEGRIELKAAPEQDEASAIPLRAGNSIRLAGGSVSKATALDKTSATAWLRGQIVFFNTPLREVIAELNRYHTGRILVVNADLDALKVSGVFTTEDPDAAVGVIADTLSVQVTRVTDYLVLLRRR